MAQWKKQELRLKKGHGWRARPGYQIFVADRGAVRFDIPRGWVVEPGPDSIRFTDCTPPDNDCLLQLSVMHLNASVDWRGLPVTQLLEQVLAGGERRLLSRGKTAQINRSGFELAWAEVRVVDPVERREACSRALIGRGGTVVPLITMDFWPEHQARFVPVWDEVLRSLQIGLYIEDPTRGPLLM